MEDVILGLDLSTTVCGICVLNLKGELVKLFHYKFKEKEMVDKGAELSGVVLGLTASYKINNFFIEERLQGFRAGGTNADAMFKTAAMNFLCQYLMYREGIPTVTLNVNAARSAAFPGFHKIARTMKGTKHKEIIFDFVRKELGDEKFPTKEMKSGARKGQTVFLDEAMDMADAYVIAKAGLKSIKT